MLWRNISRVPLLRWMSRSVSVSLAAFPLCRTLSPMKPRTPLGRLVFVCVSHRKVTSWWFISQGIQSTVLVKLLNLSCRPKPGSVKKKTLQLTSEAKFADRLTSRAQTMWQP